MYSAATVYSQPPALQRVPGAEWHAGRTRDSHRFKVLLDGEPVPAAFAASAAEGWVLCHPDPTLTAVKANSRAPLGLAYRIDPFSDKVRRFGRVEIVPVGGRRLN